MIYLDSAALVKLIRTERETPGLITWLNERSSEHLVASALVEVEVPRALRRSAPGVLGSAAGVLARLYRMEINAAVRRPPERIPIRSSGRWMPFTWLPHSC